MAIQIQDCPILSSDVATPLQQVVSTFREIDTTFSALQRTAELFTWDGDVVPEDKATWVAAYFDRLANSGSEYREIALQEIRAAGREARASLDIQELQETFHAYDGAKDRFNRLLSSTQAWMERIPGLTHNALREATHQDIQNIRDAVANIDANMESSQEIVRRAFTSLELLMGSEGTLESVIHGLENQHAHADGSAHILAIREEFTELEQIRTGIYNAARGLLDDAHIVWDLEATNNRARRKILEAMRASHQSLCDQIVPTARLSQDIKETQLLMTYSPDVIVGPDGTVWSVDNLRLSLRAYRLTQMRTRACTEDVVSHTRKLIDLRLRGTI